jgi:hypothetical protein
MLYTRHIFRRLRHACPGWPNSFVVRMETRSVPRMTADPREWDPDATTNATPPRSEFGIVSRLITRHGPSVGKEPYPDEMYEE